MFQNSLSLKGFCFCHGLNPTVGISIPFISRPNCARELLFRLLTLEKAGHVYTFGKLCNQYGRYLFGGVSLIMTL